MPFAPAQGAEVYYEISGEGEPLLLVAGIASDMASWAPVMPVLEHRYKLIRMDNRGAGRTRHDGAIQARDWIGDCIAVLDHAGIGSVDVMGHSLGGMIALRLAQQAPDRVRRLVLAATAARSDSRSLTLVGDLASVYEICPEPELWFRLLFQWLFAPPFFADLARVAEACRLSATYPYVQKPTDFRRQVDGLASMPDCDPAAIEARSMLIVGEEDVMIAPAFSRSSLAPIRRLRTVGLSGAGHALHWDRPEAFSAEVIDFLQS